MNRHAIPTIDRQRAHGARRTPRRRRRRVERRAGAHRSPHSTGSGRGMPTARCRCCGCRSGTTIFTPFARPARASRATPATSSSSAPADRASAGRRWRSLPTTRSRARAHSATARACISSTISTPTPTPSLLERLPLATTRFVAISKSGGTGETLMQIAAALAAVKAAGLAVRIPDHFVGLTEPAKGGKRNGLRVAVRRIEDRDARARPRCRRAVFRAHAMSACCRPRLSASTSTRSAPARPRRWRRCWRSARLPTCPPPSAPRCRSRSASRSR